MKLHFKFIYLLVTFINLFYLMIFQNLLNI